MNQHEFVDATPSSYRGHRFPVEIISHCGWLYHRFPLSLRLSARTVAWLADKPRARELVGTVWDKLTELELERAAVKPVPHVWTVDADRAPGVLVLRHCPRAMAWRVPRLGEDDVERILRPGGGARVHAIEYGWLDCVRAVGLFACRLPAKRFASIGEPSRRQVTTTIARSPGPP